MHFLSETFLTCITVPKLFDLHCHLYGDRRNKTFTIRIEKNNDVSMLKNMVKRDLSVALNNVDAKDLVLYHAPLSVADLADTQWDRLDLSSYPILSDATRLSAISFATQDDRLHIIVDLPSGTSTYISVTQLLKDCPEPNLPFSHRSLYPIDEEDQAICMLCILTFRDLTMYTLPQFNGKMWLP